MGIAMLFMAVGVAGIYWRQKGNATWARKIGLYASVIGAILGFMGTALITLYGTNLSLVPIFFGGGSLLLIAGMVLAGISIIQGHSLPQWAGWLLIGGVVLALPGDENSSSIWLLLSLGIAWIVIGGLLLFLRWTWTENVDGHP